VTVEGIQGTNPRHAVSRREREIACGLRVFIKPPDGNKRPSCQHIEWKSAGRNSGIGQQDCNGPSTIGFNINCLLENFPCRQIFQNATYNMGQCRRISSLREPFRRSGSSPFRVAAGPFDPKCGGADLDLSEAYASALHAPGIRARLIAWRKTVREQ